MWYWQSKIILKNNSEVTQTKLLFRLHNTQIKINAYICSIVLQIN